MRKKNEKNKNEYIPCLCPFPLLHAKGIKSMRDPWGAHACFVNFPILHAAPYLTEEGRHSGRQHRRGGSKRHKLVFHRFCRVYPIASYHRRRSVALRLEVFRIPIVLSTRRPVPLPSQAGPDVSGPPFYDFRPLLIFVTCAWVRNSPVDVSRSFAGSAIEFDLAIPSGTDHGEDHAGAVE